MRIRALMPLLVFMMSLGSTSSVSAQYYQQFSPNPGPVMAPYTQRPALSPFLNLLRGGDPAANYYLGVLPEYNQRYFQQSLPALIQDSRRTRDTYLDESREFQDLTQMAPTGHPTGFLIYNPYYSVPNARGFIPFNPGSGRQIR